MRVGLYRLEPYPNSALDKLKIHHEELGDTVEEYFPLLNDRYDKIYCSSIFTFTPKEGLLIDERWECGGTGFDIYKKLPPEIECIKPRKNYGKCMDGCNNNCKFCVVPRKEGKAKATGDLYDIWDGVRKQSKKDDPVADLTLYCNNILQLPEHFRLLCSQARKEKIRIDWNQGLDIRLVNGDVAHELSSIPHVIYHFAFDDLSTEKHFKRGVEILKKHDINCSTFLALIGFEATIFEDLYRLNMIREQGQRAFVMRYRKVDEKMPDGKITEDNEIIYNAIARWANKKSWFASMKFSEWLLIEDNPHRYKDHFTRLGMWDLLLKG